MSSIQQLDTAILHPLYAWRTEPFTNVVLLITHLGDVIFIALLSLVILAFCAHRRLYGWLGGYLICLGGAAASIMIIKHLAERLRPDTALALVTEDSFSFPSGHATLSMACYGFLAYLLSSRLSGRQQKTAVVIAAGILILSIGFSRLYLGVHYPSDIMAGFLLGSLWMLVGNITKNLIAQRINQPKDTETLGDPKP